MAWQTPRVIIAVKCQPPAVVEGPLLAIGNTTSRVDFGRDPGEWVDAWSASGVGHHWSLSVGDRIGDYRAAASLLGIDFRQV